MDNGRLREIGEKLKVSGNDVRSIKKAKKRETICETLGGWIAFVWVSISGIAGATLAAVYDHAEAVSYPNQYHRPGGRYFPILAIGAASGAVGLLLGRRVMKEEGDPGIRKKCLGTLVGIVLISIAFFSVPYFIFDSSSMVYGVHSRNPKTTIVPLHQNLIKHPCASK